MTLPGTPYQSNRQRRWLRSIVAVVLLGAAVAFIHYRMNAAQSGFGGHGDEPSHFLSGVLIHDYLASGFHQRPMEFARRFYTHIPFMAIGHWPPLFYLLEGVWMLAFGVSRSSGLLLMWLLTLVAGLLVFRFVAPRNGSVMGLAAALAFLSIPSVQWNACLVMTDIAVGAVCLGASLSFAGYIESPGWRRALLAGAMAGTAVLTKYSALFLPVPLAVILLAESRRKLLGTWQTWLIPALSAAMVAPWAWFTRAFADKGYDAYAPAHRWEGLWRLLELISAAKKDLGVPCLSLACVCLAAAAWNWRRLDVAQRLLLLHGCAVLVFVAFSPVLMETRYLIPAYIAFAAVLPAGVGILTGWFGKGQRWVAPAFALLVLFLFCRVPGRLPHLPTSSTREIAMRVVQQREAGNSPVLVATAFEGALIADFAVLEERRPSRMYMRPTKLLAQQTWLGNHYVLKAGSPAAAEKILEQCGVGFVILSRQPWQGAAPHEKVLRELMTQDSMDWRPLQHVQEPTGTDFDVFQSRLPGKKPEELPPSCGPEFLSPGGA